MDSANDASRGAGCCVTQISVRGGCLSVISGHKKAMEEAFASGTCELMLRFLQWESHPTGDGGGGAGGLHDSIVAQRVFVVSILKTMQSSSFIGVAVSEKLASAPIWRKYESQSHDLFLTNQHASMLLQDGSEAVQMLEDEDGETIAF